VCPDAVITVYRERKKAGPGKAAGREPVAVISNVRGNIEVTVDANSRETPPAPSSRGGRL
jgi:hypothetical protein